MLTLPTVIHERFSGTLCTNMINADFLTFRRRFAMFVIAIVDAACSNHKLKFKKMHYLYIQFVALASKYGSVRSL